MPPAGDAPILDVCTGTADLALAYWRASGAASADRGRRFLPPDARHRPREMPPRGGRRPYRARRGRHPAAALPRRHVPDRLRGLRAAERERHRRRPAGDGAGVPARRARGRARVLHAHGLAAAAALRLVLPPRAAAHRPGPGTKRQAAYNYLPQSVGQFPQGEALAERMRAAGLRRGASSIRSRSASPRLYVGERRSYK